jgi:hypothetical protein
MRGTTHAACAGVHSSAPTRSVAPPVLTPHRRRRMGCRAFMRARIACSALAAWRAWAVCVHCRGGLSLHVCAYARTSVSPPHPSSSAAAASARACSPSRSTWPKRSLSSPADAMRLAFLVTPLGVQRCCGSCRSLSLCLRFSNPEKTLLRIFGIDDSTTAPWPCRCTLMGRHDVTHAPRKFWVCQGEGSSCC